MTRTQTAPAGQATGRPTETGTLESYAESASNASVERQTLLAILDGSAVAAAWRRRGTPCPIILPADPGEGLALIDAHIGGAPATVTFTVEGSQPWRERASPLELHAYCPSGDGVCRWLAVDLDAAGDHGSKGLADSAHAARVFAERLDNAGLFSGLLAVRSGGGRGRHLWIFSPWPVAILEASSALALIAARAFAIARQDVEDSGRHAFRTGDGGIAEPGKPGAVELIPRNTGRPRLGWAMALPFGGAFAARGGGVAVDPFEDYPIALDRVPRCSADAWTNLIREAKNIERNARRRAFAQRASIPGPRTLGNPPSFSDRSSPHLRTMPFARSNRGPDFWRSQAFFDRLDPRTRDLIEGRVPEGARNHSAYVAACELLGRGCPPDEAERLIIAGSIACGLPEEEARAAFESALRKKGGRR